MRFLLNKQGQEGWRTDLFWQEHSKRGHQAALLPRSSAKFELKELTAERTLRQHGHFSWNFEKKSNVVIKFSNNETKNWKPLKKYRDNQYPYFSCALYRRGGHLFEVGSPGLFLVSGWALIRGWALKRIDMLIPEHFLVPDPSNEMAATKQKFSLIFISSFKWIQRAPGVWCGTRSLSHKSLAKQNE